MQQVESTPAPALPPLPPPRALHSPRFQSLPAPLLLPKNAAISRRDDVGVELSCESVGGRLRVDTQNSTLGQPKGCKGRKGGCVHERQNKRKGERGATEKRPKEQILQRTMNGQNSKNFSRIYVDYK